MSNSGSDGDPPTRRIDLRAATSEFDQLQSASGPTSDPSSIILSVQLFLTTHPPPLSLSTPSSFNTGNLHPLYPPGSSSFPPTPMAAPSSLPLPPPGFPSSPYIPGTITPTHLTYLPPTTSNIRSMLYSEFELVMVMHPCFSLSDMRRRIDGMFKWGDETKGKKGRGGSKKKGNGTDVGESDTGESGMEDMTGGKSRPRVPGAHERRGGSVSDREGSRYSGGSGSRGGRSAGSSGRTATRAPVPTLAFFAVASAAFALGAQSYTAKVAYGGFPGGGQSGYAPAQPQASQGADSAARDHRTTSMSGRPGAANGRERTYSAVGSTSMSVDDYARSDSSHVQMPPPSTTPISPTYSSSNGGPYNNGASLPFPSSSSNTIPTAPAPSPSKLPSSHDAKALHALCQAALTAHDSLGLPPSLDYIVAHILCWLYRLHALPPSTPNAHTEDSNSGLSSGGVTVVDPEIWKGIGKIVNVARGMGLGIDPDEVTPHGLAGDNPPERAENENDGDDEHGSGTRGKMTLWEKEMRRRIWWDVCYYDL